MKSRLYPSAVLCLAAFGFAACSRHESATAAAAETPAGPPVAARIVTIHRETIPLFVEISGTVRPVQRAQLAAKVMGTIAELPVTLGQRVHAGDVLVRVNAAEINARVAQAQSQLNQIRRDLDRERGLLPKGASTVDMVRSLEDRAAGAEAMMREAEVMLGYTTLRAPFDGVVSRRPANVGDLASPGLPLLELEGLGHFEIEAGVPDSIAPSLTVGAELPVELPALGLTFSGRLAELSSAADATAHTVVAKIAVPETAAVRSGAFARVRVPASSAPALLAPASAVTAIGQIERVFVAGPDNRSVLRLVKTGASRDGRIEILSGLDDGERVIANPPASLREGQLLALQP